MKIPDSLPQWDGSTANAVKFQRELAQRVEREDRLSEVHHIAGIDVSANSYTGQSRAAIVIVSFPDLHEVEVARAEMPLLMPYIPGLLSFRETPVIMQALAQVRQTPDLLMVDGQGIAHPRRIGIASHLGVLLDMPAIGCAKSILRGKHAPLPDEVGARADLVDHGEVIGLALRTRRHANPLIISIGNRVSLATAVAYVERCLQGGYRLPEPTRLAHLRAGTPDPATATDEAEQAQLWDR